MAVSVNINTLNATTDKFYMEEIHDQFFLSRAFLVKLRSREKPIDGGTSIQVPIKYQQNTNTGRWNGGDDTLDTTGQEFVTQATFNWKFLKTSIQLPETKILQNAGKSKIVDLLEAESENAVESLSDQFDIDLYLDGSADSNGRLGIDGLAAVCTLGSNPTPGAYGGIDRASPSSAGGTKASPLGNSFWNANVVAANGNQTYNLWKNPVVMDNSTVLTLAKLQAIYGACGGADVCLTSQTLYDKYWSLLTVIQRQMTDDELGKAGFTALKFNDAAVIVGDNIDNTGKWYNLNMKFFELKPHREMNFNPTEFRKPPNQRVLVKHINWMGNLVCKRPNRQGLITGMTAS